MLLLLLLITSGKWGQCLDGTGLCLPFDMGLRLALAEEFEAALGQVDDLALVVLFELVF